MRAVQLEKFGEPLKLRDIPEPVLRPGGVLVRMQAAPVLSYMKHVVSGKLAYRMPAPPFTIGTNGVGVIEKIAPDVFGLEVGQRVCLDPRMQVHENVADPDQILIGLTAISPKAARLQEIWPDGVFADLALIPAECVTPVPELDHLSAIEISTIGKFTVAYGGFHRGGLQAGETVIVNGATGNLGSAAVVLALAMGAAKVVALGRDAAALDTLARANKARIIPVALSGDIEKDRSRILDHCGGPADLALDIVGQAADGNSTLTTLNCLAPYGRLVLMGSMTVPLGLDYNTVMLRNIDIRGAFMFPRPTLHRLATLVASGQLNLDLIETRDFPLEKFADAIEQATKIRGLQYCVLRMD